MKTWNLILMIRVIKRGLKDTSKVTIWENFWTKKSCCAPNLAVLYRCRGWPWLSSTDLRRLPVEDDAKTLVVLNPCTIACNDRRLELVEAGSWDSRCWWHFPAPLRVYIVRRINLLLSIRVEVARKQVLFFKAHLWQVTIATHGSAASMSQELLGHWDEILKNPGTDIRPNAEYQYIRWKWSFYIKVIKFQYNPRARETTLDLRWGSSQCTRT